MNYEIKGTPFPVVICKLANGERHDHRKGCDGLDESEHGDEHGRRRSRTNVLQGILR